LRERLLPLGWRRRVDLREREQKVGQQEEVEEEYTVRLLVLAAGHCMWFFTEQGTNPSFFEMMLNVLTSRWRASKRAVDARSREVLPSMRSVKETWKDWCSKSKRFPSRADWNSRLEL